MNRLKDKVAVITGAALGIGAATARRLGEEGAAVALLDLHGAEGEALAARLDAAGIKARFWPCDVAKEAEVKRVFGEVENHFGRIDVLVNNAGGSAHTPLRIEDVTEEHFDRVMSWNVRGTFFCIKAALPHLKERGGSIVNMASIAGRAGTELVSPQYSAAKAGIIGMTRNLARHLGPHQIRVNVIAPGFIKSGPRAEAIWRTRDESLVLNQVPLRRRGEMDEIGKAALFLASDASSYTTGCVIDVNGGFFTV